MADNNAGTVSTDRNALNGPGEVSQRVRHVVPEVGWSRDSINGALSQPTEGKTTENRTATMAIPSLLNADYSLQVNDVHNNHSQLHPFEQDQSFNTLSGSYKTVPLESYYAVTLDKEVQRTLTESWKFHPVDLSIENTSERHLSSGASPSFSLSKDQIELLEQSKVSRIQKAVDERTINAEQVSKCLTWENFSSLEDVHQLLDPKALNDELDNFFGADEAANLAIIKNSSAQPSIPKTDGEDNDALNTNDSTLKCDAVALNSPLDLDFLSAIVNSGATFNTIDTASTPPISHLKESEQAIDSAIADTTLPSLAYNAPTTPATTILSATNDIILALGQHDEVNPDSDLAVHQAEDDVDAFIQGLLRPLSPRTDTLAPQTNATVPPISSATAFPINNDQIQPWETPLTPLSQARHDALSAYVQATSPEWWASMSNDITLDTGLAPGRDPEDIASSQIPNDFHPEALAFPTPGPSFNSNNVEAGFYQNKGPPMTTLAGFDNVQQGWQPHTPFQLSEPFQYNPSRPIPTTPTRAPKSRTPKQLPTPHRTPKASNQDRIKKPRAKISALPGQETTQKPAAKKTPVRRRAKNTAAEVSGFADVVNEQDRIAARNKSKGVFALMDAKAKAAGLQTKKKGKKNDLATPPNGVLMGGVANEQQMQGGWMNITPVTMGNGQRQKRKRDESDGYGIVEGEGMGSKKAKITGPIEVIDLTA